MSKPKTTNYPSLYAIGDAVTVKNFPAVIVSVKFTGDGHPAPGKVIYEIKWRATDPDSAIEEFMSEDIYPADALASLEG